MKLKICYLIITATLLSGCASHFGARFDTSGRLVAVQGKGNFSGEVEQITKDGDTIRYKMDNKTELIPSELVTFAGSR